MSIAKKTMLAVTIALITTVSAGPTFANQILICTPVCGPHYPPPPPPPPPPTWVLALAM
jgi:hypothetical protein